jgi:hypothetical protein
VTPTSWLATMATYTVAMVASQEVGWHAVTCNLHKADTAVVGGLQPEARSSSCSSMHKANGNRKSSSIN